MNLHAIASGVISAVNPNQTIQVQTSAGGYTTNASGKRTPLYDPPVFAVGQVQQLTGQDLKHLDSLNIQGSQRRIYISGSIDAITRIKQTGGDLIVLSDNTLWLTTYVLERWYEGARGPSWCAVAVTLQDGS